MCKESNTLKFKVADFIKELKKLGSKNQALFLKKMQDLELPKLEFEIMKYRYVDGLFFKQIYPLVGVEERSMYALHKNAINKAFNSSIYQYFTGINAQ